MGEFIWGRYALWAYTGFATIIFCGLAVVSQPYFLLGTAISGGLFALGFHDFVQKKKGFWRTILCLVEPDTFLSQFVLNCVNIFGRQTQMSSPIPVTRERWCISAREVFSQPVPWVPF